MGMFTLTTEDLAELASMLKKFDAMGGPFSGERNYTAYNGHNVPVRFQYDTDNNRHVMVVNPSQ